MNFRNEIHYHALNWWRSLMSMIIIIIIIMQRLTHHVSVIRMMNRRRGGHVDLRVAVSVIKRFEFHFLQ